MDNTAERPSIQPGPRIGNAGGAAGAGHWIHCTCQSGWTDPGAANDFAARSRTGRSSAAGRKPPGDRGGESAGEDFGDRFCGLRLASTVGAGGLGLRLVDRENLVQEHRLDFRLDVAGVGGTAVAEWGWGISDDHGGVSGVECLPSRAAPFVAVAAQT